MLPTPVFLAGGSLCLLAGYLLGAVTTPGSPPSSTAKVASFERTSMALCLGGDGVADEQGLDDRGWLCGTYRPGAGVADPLPGDTFRFVVLRRNDSPGSDAREEVVIYGNVQRPS